MLKRKALSTLALQTRHKAGLQRDPGKRHFLFCHFPLALRPPRDAPLKPSTPASGHSWSPAAHGCHASTSASPLLSTLALPPHRCPARKVAFQEREARRDEASGDRGLFLGGGRRVLGPCSRQSLGPRHRQGPGKCMAVRQHGRLGAPGGSVPAFTPRGTGSSELGSRGLAAHRSFFPGGREGSVAPPPSLQ